MLALPEGWESDYDGSRWFYRYKPNGLTQFQFPQPGDEFPAFVGDNVELEPEERLQMRQNTSPGSASRADTRTSGIGSRLGKEPATGQDEFAMSATGYFDPSSFMHFGPDDLDDDDLGSNELGKESGIENRNNDAELDSVSVSLQSPAPTPSSAKSEIAATDSGQNRPTSAEPISPPAELSADNEQKPSPVGLVPELAGPHTAKCAEELAPVELDAASPASAAAKPNDVHSEIAELSADNKPREPKPPPPRPAPPPMQPVDSLPLVSASFAYPPVRTVETPTVTTMKELKAAEVQVHTEMPRARTMPVGQDQTRYQPFTLANRVPDGAGRQLHHSQRSSMVLSSTTVLQSQNTELGPLSRKPGPEPTDHDTEKPEMFLPPVDPRIAKTSPAPASSLTSGSASVRVPQILPVPPKIPLDDPSPEHLPKQTGPRPLPGSGARHESISSNPDQLVQDRVNPGLYYAPSILKPAHRRSNFSLPGSDQPSGPPKSPPRPMLTREVPSTQREYATRQAPLRQVANPPYPLEQVSPPHPRARGSLPYPDDQDPRPSVAHVAPPPRPPKPPSPERRTPAYSQPTPSHSRDSVPDPLDQIDDVISELSNLMATKKDQQPTYTMPMPREAGTYTTSPPPTQAWGPRHNSFPTSAATLRAGGIMPSPPSVSDSQSQQSPPFKVSPVHTLDMSEQRSQTGPAARQSISGSMSGSVPNIPAHVSATKTSQTSHYPFPNATVTTQAQSSPERTIYSAPMTGSSQDQIEPTSKSPSAPVVSQETAPSYTSNAARDSTGGLPRPPADRSSLALGPSSPPLPPPQSEVSSPSLSVTSLHRAVSTASSQAQAAAAVSRSASVSGQQQVIHEMDSIPAKMPSSPPPDPVSEAPSPKAKPFPMLPGQVTPMPSQVGSKPVPIPVQPDVNEPTAHADSSTSSAQPQFPQSSAAWVAQGTERPGLNHPPPQSGPAFLQTPVLAGPGGQQQPLPQTQPTPDQLMAPQVYGVQYQPPALPLNGAAPPSSKGGKGVKKWAKKIFNSSSSKQNATGAGATGPPSIQQLAMSVPNNVPLKAPVVPVQQQAPPAQSALAQFNPVVPGPAPTQPPIVTQLSGPPTALQAPMVPPAFPPTSSVAPQQHPSAASNHPIPQRQPEAGPTNPTNPNGAVGNTTTTTTSTVMPAVVNPQAPHRLSLSAAAQSAHPPAASHAHPIPQANGVPRTVATNDAPAPRPCLTNGPAAAVGSGPAAAPPGGGWQTKSVDYSGGDWGDGW